MKGIIVAAGYGTRFLPVTKTVPKEMLPLLDRPSIDFIVQEFLDSGIRDVLVITSRRKKALEDYFDREVELESVFRSEGREEHLRKIAPPDARMLFVRQQEMKGTGHALLLAKEFVGEDPCVVAYPDDILFGEKPLARQLIDTWKESGSSVLATIHDPPSLNSYGVVALEDDGFHVRDIVEKPPAGSEPSREASIGRYLYTPEMFRYLEEGWEKHEAGEYYHTFALKRLMRQGKVVYTRAEGVRMDTGTPEGYLRALLTYASRTPALREIIREFSD